MKSLQMLVTIICFILGMVAVLYFGLTYPVEDRVTTGMKKIGLIIYEDELFLHLIKLVLTTILIIVYGLITTYLVSFNEKKNNLKHLEEMDKILTRRGAGY
ncbi:hypothetical protein ABC382_00170 [Lysinibacillus sp. 1P01SD]|uniref:hypothetical protein n=1 Tax=Lysinibacillus sp. 1P01SD TaxID=3132285 RepID=UPI00399F6836